MIASLFYLSLMGIQASNALALHPRIMNGEDATNAFKTVARIVWSAALIPGILKGTGTVIGAHWVLTAADIVALLPSFGTTSVIAGKYAEYTTEGRYQTVIIETKIIHENYKGERSAFNIGLLGTNQTIHIYNNYVAAARLPVQDSIYSGKVHMLGFGRTRFGVTEVPSRTLQKVLVSIQDSGVCEAQFRKHQITYKLVKSQMCIHKTENNPVPLKGDGGGPLIRHFQNGIYEVVGIISWTYNSPAMADLPSVHIRVSFFIEWIAKKIAENPVIDLEA